MLQMTVDFVVVAAVPAHPGPLVHNVFLRTPD